MAARLMTSAATGFITLLACGVQVALAAGPGHLAALTARQALRDEVCVAMADGRIDAAERYIILTDAKQILKAEEYATFRRSFDRLAPPQLAKTKSSAKVARKPPSSKLRPSASPPTTSPDGFLNGPGTAMRVVSASTVR